MYSSGLIYICVGILVAVIIALIKFLKNNSG